MITILVNIYSELTTWEPIIKLPEWAKPEKWPKLPWPFASAFLPVACAFILLEGGVRLHEETVKTYETRLAEEISKQRIPEVVVTCDWPRDTHPVLPGGVHRPTPSIGARIKGEELI